MIDLEEIIEVVSLVTNVSIEDIKGGSRKGQIPDARKMVSLIGTFAGHTIKAVGKAINNDHSSVVVQRDRAYQRLDCERKFTFDNDFTSKVNACLMILRQEMPILNINKQIGKKVMQLRDYQKDIAEQATQILKNYGIVYLSMEVRVGKTLTALQVASNIGAKNVLFVTKKKAISSIEKDYKDMGYGYEIKITNYEQLVNIRLVNNYDMIIVDESHSNKAYPKLSQRTQYLKELVGNKPVVLLSGTPTPESYSELFHQFWISNNTPFKQKNFYSWAKEYVAVKDKKISANVTVKDYSRADRDKVMAVLGKYFIAYSQKDAGFLNADIEESIIFVKVDPRIYALSKVLMRDKYFQFKDGDEIVCDTAAKLQTKLHQLYSGTMITEQGNRKILDRSKVDYIRANYKGQKIAVYYKFQAEGEVLKQLLKTTESPEEFNQSQDTNLIFISQIQSGSMGVNISTADVLIFYNIDFAAVQYWQARARIQNMEREKQAVVHWLFADNGIEEKIYKAVLQKKDYTLSYFVKDFGIDKGLFNGIGIAKESIKVPEKSWNLRTKNHTSNTIRSA